jgi:hypothetical protein
VFLFRINSETTLWKYLVVSMGGKVMVKYSMFLIKHHVMKTYWESEDIVPCIPNFALDGGEWSASHSR